MTSLSFASLSPAQQSNVQAIINVANKLGVNARLAVADSYHESGLSDAATGDNGSSFGLFQLHRGGELGSNTEAWARDPINNATRALTVFAANKDKYSDPGQLAAASERPANQPAYAAAVDALFNDPNFLPSLPGADPNYQPPAGSGTDNAELLVAPGADASHVLNALNPVTWLGDAASAISGVDAGLIDWVQRAGIIAFGLVFLLVGLVVIARAGADSGGSSSPSLPNLSSASKGSGGSVASDAVEAGA